MSQTYIAFVYNVRHKHPDPKDPLFHLEADFDDPATIEQMIEHFRSAGFDIIPIEADERAYFSLYENRERIDLVFNYSMGIVGRDRYAHIPAICEMLDLPYTGSPPGTQAIIMNKSRMQDMLAASGIPRLASQLFTNAGQSLDPSLGFPLIVKPVAQGSSAGITNESLVTDGVTLARQVEFITKTFGEPALVQPFLTGREFSVSLLGNPPEFLPIIEADHSVLPKNYHPLDSLEVKWVIEENPAFRNHLICPAALSPAEDQAIKDIAKKAWEVLGILDLCRIDLRYSEAGVPYILDINSPPGLIPPEISSTSYFPLAAKVAGIEYNSLLSRIVAIAQERYAKQES